MLARPTILLVEDDDVDVEAVMRSIKKYNLPVDVVTAHDGQDALDVIKGRDGERRIDSPIIILLDLNMPRMNGLEFLQALREDPDHASSIVFVLTTSTNDMDKRRAYQKNIAGYLEKAAMGSNYEKLTGLLDKYNAAVSLPG